MGFMGFMHQVIGSHFFTICKDEVYRTLFCRNGCEYDDFNNIEDDSRFTPPTPGCPGYGYPETSDISAHIHLASLQNGTCSLHENLQGPNDSSENKQGSSALCSPTADPLRLREICASTKNFQGSSSLMEDQGGTNVADELKVHCDLSSCREDQQWSEKFDSQTEDFQGSNENFSLIEQGEDLEGSIGFYSLGENQDGSGYFSPLINKPQMSREEKQECMSMVRKLHKLTQWIKNFWCSFPSVDQEMPNVLVPPTDELLQYDNFFSNSFVSHDPRGLGIFHYNDPKKSRTLHSNDLHIPQTNHDSDFHCSDTLHIEDLQISQTLDEEVVQRAENSQAGGLRNSKDFRAKNLRKAMDNNNATASMSSMSEGTKRAIPLSSVCRKDGNLFRSSDTNVFAHKTPCLMRLITKTYLRIVILLVSISKIASEDVHLDCTGKEHLTSTNYPSDYPNDANMQWHVTVPPGRWILVEFNDFNLEEQYDFLFLVDVVHFRNTARYTGDVKRIPSFLTQGNAMDATFASFGIGTRRGFNLTVSCYEKSNTKRGRLAGGNTSAEGLLELLSESGKWVGVCEDNISASLAEVICGELGFPGVKEIFYTTDGCQSDENNQTCIRAPSCEDNTYLLQDCSFIPGNCTSFSSATIKCYQPGYKGCYEFQVNQLQNGSPYNSVPQCVSSCRAKTADAIAIVNGEECFCSTASQVNLPGRTLAPNQLTCINQDKLNQHIVNALVYDVSVGFCNETADVMNGAWDSTITWFGSTLHLTCDDGYSPNGSETLQCVPGISPYHPVWNGAIPTCEKLGGGTSLTSDIPQPEERDFEMESNVIFPLWTSTIIAIIISIIIIIIIIIIITTIWKKRQKLSSWRSFFKQTEFPSAEERGWSSGFFAMHSRGRHRTEQNMHAGNSFMTALRLNNDDESPTNNLNIQTQHADNNTRRSPPSNASITLFQSLQQTTQQRENHYQTGDNVANSYYSTMGSGGANENNTIQTNLNIGSNENSYELASIQEDIQNPRETSECRPEVKSMSNRPLPHRPTSSGVHEGPSLPPRGQGNHSSTGSSNLKQENTCPGNSDIEAFAVDYNTSANNGPQGLSAISQSHILHHTKSSHDKDQTSRKGESTQKAVDVYLCTGATPRASAHHEYYSVGDLEDEEEYNRNNIPLQSKPDPFYHRLVDDPQHMSSDRDPLCQSESNDKDVDTCMMVDNILYNPFI